MQAHIDRITLVSIQGWAFDPDSSTPVTIEVRKDGKVLALSVADQPRPDVGKHYGTNGLHGFLVSLPEMPSAVNSLQVFARSISGEEKLIGTAFTDNTKFREPGKVELRDTMILVRPALLASILGNETLVICGSTRGGTSIAAYALLKLGYYLGDQLNIGNHEDREILSAIENRRQMAKIIEDRNRRMKRWGFKLPKATHHAGWLVDALRNPIFMVVFRNPAAIAKTILSRDPTVTVDLESLAWAFQHGLRSMEIGTDVLRTKAPSILLDIDAARGTPDRLVRELAQLFGPNEVSDQIVDGIAGQIRVAGYKPV